MYRCPYMVKCTFVSQTGHFTPSLRSRAGNFRTGLNYYWKIKGIVMSDKKSNRDKWIHLRLTTDEYKKIELGFSKSTSRKLSGYVRFILLEKPITVYTRNQSYDEFVTEMLALRQELNAIGNNFNQLVKKLHTITHDEEIKGWAVLNEGSKNYFFKKMDEINLKMTQIYRQWSQE